MSLSKCGGALVDFMPRRHGPPHININSEWLPSLSLVSAQFRARLDRSTFALVRSQTNQPSTFKKSVYNNNNTISSPYWINPRPMSTPSILLVLCVPVADQVWSLTNYFEFSNRLIRYAKCRHHVAMRISNISFTFS